MSGSDHDLITGNWHLVSSSFFILAGDDARCSALVQGWVRRIWIDIERRPEHHNVYDAHRLVYKKTTKGIGGLDLRELASCLASTLCIPLSTFSSREVLYNPKAYPKSCSWWLGVSVQLFHLMLTGCALSSVCRRRSAGSKGWCCGTRLLCLSLARVPARLTVFRNIPWNAVIS